MIDVVKEGLIVHNKNFQKYEKIIIVDDEKKPILEYTLTHDFTSKESKTNV